MTSKVMDADEFRLATYLEHAVPMTQHYCGGLISFLKRIGAEVTVDTERRIREHYTYDSRKGANKTHQQHKRDMLEFLTLNDGLPLAPKKYKKRTVKQ